MKGYSLTNPENGLYLDMQLKNLNLSKSQKDSNLTSVVEVLQRALIGLTAWLLPASFSFFGKSGVHSGFPSFFFLPII